MGGCRLQPYTLGQRTQHTNQSNIGSRDISLYLPVSPICLLLCSSFSMPTTSSLPSPFLFWTDVRHYDNHSVLYPLEQFELNTVAPDNAPTAFPTLPPPPPHLKAPADWMALVDCSSGSGTFAERRRRKKGEWKEEEKLLSKHVINLIC